MSLLEECREEWLYNLKGVSFDDRMEVVISKVLDRTIEAVKTLGSYDEETIIKVIHALKEGKGD